MYAHLVLRYLFRQFQVFNIGKIRQQGAELGAGRISNYLKKDACQKYYVQFHCYFPKKQNEFAAVCIMLQWIGDIYASY